MEITEQNFKDYFFPAKSDYKPEKGQILARWRATADFVDGWVKRNIIQILCTDKKGAETSVKIMKKVVSVVEEDAIKVLKEMAEDLLKGLSYSQVAGKPYKMVIEQFYWTKKEHVPDDPHWDLINTYDLRIQSHILNENAVTDTIALGTKHGDSNEVAETNI